MLDQRWNNLSKSDRRAVAEKLMEFGNIVGVSLVFNQLINNGKFLFLAAILGFCMLISMYVIAILLLKGNTK